MRMAVWIAMGVVAAGSAQEALTPRVVPTRLKTTDTVIALAVIEPQVGETDVAPRLQGLIDRVAAAGGGVLFLGEGTYPLRQPLVIREGVTVRGEWAAPDSGVRGTVVAIEDRAGTEAAPDTITLERGSGLREVTLWYPNQSSERVVPYPWTVGTSAKVGGDNVTLQNVTLVNPFRGIRIGPEWNELHTLRHVYMAPLDTGLAIDTTTDIGRLNHVVLSPRVWEQSGLAGAPSTGASRDALRRRLAEAATGVDVGRSDWEYIVGVEAEGLATGLRFRPGKQGTTNAVMLDCSFRDCGTALRLDALNGVGLSATACQFHGTRPLYGPPAFATVAQFNTCAFSGSKGEAVTLEGTGLLSFQNCRFGGTVAATAGQVSLVDCDLSKSAPHVALGPDVLRARILGCRGEEGLAIRNETRAADVVVSHGPTGSTALRWTPHPPAPVRGPRGPGLFVVSSFGAAPELADNTEPFAAALEAARAGGGGTVYVPAGNYRFKGHLTVPAGVELRGCFDVPHHTVSAGSVLMPLEGRRREDGIPFIRLEAESGLRGLTVWYSEQQQADPVPYPWTVQSLGAGCWLEDITLGNAWQGVDFWSHPSDGHVIRYLAGACFRRGLWVSKCDTQGWVEDLQFNPHYSLRLHASLPRPAGGAGDIGSKVIDIQRKQLEALVFGRCREEHVFATFLYAAHDGIAFRDDRGGAQARVLIHGTDTGSRALVLEKVGEAGVELINAQLVPLGNWVRAAIISTRDFDGSVRLFNSQVWAGPQTAEIAGRGDLLIQQMNTLSGPIRVEGGTVRLENVTFGKDLTPQVAVGAKGGPVSLIGCLGTRSAFRWEADAPGTARAFANAASLQPRAAAAGRPAPASRSWSEMAVLENTIAEVGGGRRAVADPTCTIQTLDDPAPGSRVVRFAGRVEDPAHAFCYVRLVDGPFAVLPDSVLRGRIKPLTEAGRNTSIDARFAAGVPLRDRGLQTRDGLGVHPSGAKGKVDQWREIEIPLGSLAGQTIETLMVGFDARGASGEFAALVEGVSLTSELGSGDWHVTATPAGGAVPAGTTVTLTSAAPRIRYTLDGSNPGPQALVYATPIALPAGTPTELRFCAEAANGRLSPVVFATVYE